MRALALIGVMAVSALPGAALSNEAPVSSGQVVDTANDAVQRMTVPVMINGQGPFQFVIDTGADRTVISEELADRLGLPERDKAKLHAIGGSRDVKTVQVDSVQVSTKISRNVLAAALPASNIGADGLLGIDSLDGQRIIMDFKAQTMEVLPARRGEKEHWDEQGMIVVTAKTRLGQLVMVDADANGQKVWVVVDTGAQNSIGNTRLRSLLLKRKSRINVKAIEMTDVLGRKTPAEYALVGRMRFGDVAMENAAIAFADVHPFKLFELHKRPSMLLGMESLRNFDRISVDFANRKIKFLLPKTPAEMPVFPAN